MTDVIKTPILKVENLIHGVGRDFPQSFEDMALM